MYKFALNNIKLQRAIGICNGNPDTGCVRAVYEKLGGAIDPTYVEEVVPVVEEEPVVKVIEEEVTMSIVEKVTKKTKKK